MSVGELPSLTENSQTKTCACLYNAATEQHRTRAALVHTSVAAFVATMLVRSAGVDEVASMSECVDRHGIVFRCC